MTNTRSNDWLRASGVIGKKTTKSQTIQTLSREDGGIFSFKQKKKVL